MTIPHHYFGTVRRSHSRHRSSAGRRVQKKANLRCNIFDALSEPVFVQDADTLALLETNEAGQQLLDSTAESALSPNSSKQTIDPSAGFLHRFTKARAAEQSVFEFEAQLKNGSVAWFEASVREVSVGDRRCLISQVRDITRRHHLERQARNAMKMEAIGDLAGGVANDLNSILAAMTLNLGFILLDPSLTPESREGLKDLENEAYRAAKVVRHLLYFARRNVLALEELELGGFIKTQLPDLRQLAGPEIDLEFQPAPRDLRVKADKRSVKDALHTLCANARDSISHQGRIVLRLEAIEIDAEAARKHPETRAGKFACLSVQDTGSGMAKEILEKIFEPFFTTNKSADADGMGLAVVYGAVKQHDGWVQAESTPGQGSTFSILFPEAGQ